MDAVIDFIRLRGEYVSLFIAAGVLLFGVGPVSRLTGLARERTGDLFWQGGIAFVVAGRLGEVLLQAPRTLVDPLALVRLDAGIEPLIGAVAVAAVVAWHARRDPASAGALLLATATGLVAAGIAYDIACVVRDGCAGAPVSRPFGFPMSGLSDPVFPTPLVSAAIMLGWLGLVISVSAGLPHARAAALILGGLALSRALLTPLSAIGSTAVGPETWMLGIAGLAAIAWPAVAFVRRARYAPVP